MNLEKQTCSLELSKRLKELGIRQYSQFYHVEAKSIMDHVFESSVNLIAHFSQCSGIGDSFVSAFTVAELGEILPKYVSVKTENESEKIFSNFKFVTTRSLIVKENIPIEVWNVNYICDTTNELRNWLFDPLLTKAIYDETEAEARAKMLIYLLENKLMELPNE